MYRGEVKELVAAFRRVIELEPTNGGGHYYLAIGMHADGKTDAARASLGKAMALGHTPEPEFLKALESAPRLDSGNQAEAKVGVSGTRLQTFEFGPDSEESTK
jgi:hypothetical protein